MENNLMNYKKTLEKKFLSIKNNVYGLNTCLSEYICDKSGCISETLVDEFIHELHNIRMNKYWEYQYYGISGVRNKCFEALIYLAIMSYHANSTIDTFADILDLLDELNEGYKSLSDLHSDEQSTSSTHPKGFFGVLFNNYHDLVGHPISDDISDEENIVIAENLKSQASATYNNVAIEIHNSYKHYDTEPWYPGQEPSIWTMSGLDEPLYIPSDEADSIGDDFSSDHNSNSIKLHFHTHEDLMEMKKLKKLQCNKRKQTLKNPDRFIQAYKDFRKLFFIEGVSRNELEEIFIYFLDKKGKVKVSIDRNFATVYNSLNEIDRLNLVNYEFKNKL